MTRIELIIIIGIPFFATVILAYTASWLIYKSVQDFRKTSNKKAAFIYSIPTDMAIISFTVSSIILDFFVGDYTSSASKIAAGILVLSIVLGLIAFLGYIYFADNLWEEEEEAELEENGKYRNLLNKIINDTAIRDKKLEEKYLV